MGSLLRRWRVTRVSRRSFRGIRAPLVVVALAAALAASALSPGSAAATSTYNFSPDCLYYGQANPFSLSDATCEFSVTSFSLTAANSSDNNTTTASISWSDGRTPVADLNGNVGPNYPATNQPQVVTLTLNWGDNSSSSYDIFAPSLDASTVFPNLAANCDTQHTVDIGGGRLSCNTGLNSSPSPITHQYATGGSFSVEVTATLHLANLCQFGLCPPAGSPPYYVNSNAAATAWSSQVTPTGNFFNAPPSVVTVGQPLSVSLHTDDSDNTAYYNVHVGWDGVHSVQLDSGEIPGFGSENWPSTMSGGWDDTLRQAYTGHPLQHTYSHVGTYQLYALIAQCTLPPGGSALDCAEGPYNIGQGQSIPISEVGELITVVPAPVTATVSGSQVFGASAGSLTQSSNAPSGVTVSGTPTCSTVNGGTAINASLPAGSYTIDASSCSGLTSSDASDYPLVYAGGTFTVTPGVAVTVTATEDWDQGNTTYSYTKTASPDPSVGVTGSVSCGSVDGGRTLIYADAGTHAIDPNSCHGLTPTDATYGVTYTGTLTVNQIPLDMTVSGTWAYGSTPSFTATPPGISPFLTINGSVTSCWVDVNNVATEISSSLPAGTWSIDLTKQCTGQTLSGDFGPDMFLRYSGSVTVNPVIIPATVSGSWTYGQTPSVSVVASPPSGVSVTGTGTCTTVDGGTPISSTLAAGTHTIDASSCSGLTAPASYTISYSGSLDVGQATPTMTLSGGPFTYNGSPQGVSVSVKGAFGESVSGAIVPTYNPGGSPPVNAGTYGVSVNFTSSDPNYTNAAASTTITIGPAKPTVAITGGTFGFDTKAHPGLPSVVGVDGITPVSGSSMVAYNPGGPAAPVNAGTYSDSVSFTSTDSNYTNGSATNSITITPATPTVTVTGGTFTYNAQTHAASATVTGVGGATVIGTTVITYSPGGASAPVTAGSYGVSAAFTSGDSNYTNGSGAGTVVISQATPTVSVSSSANPSILGQTVSFTATVSAVAGSPTGKVQFTLDGSNFGSPVSLSAAGKATSGSISSLAIGGHAMKAIYLGDTNFKSVTVTLTQDVTYQVKALYPQSTKNNSGASVPIKVEILNYAGTDLSSASIVVTLASVALSPSPAPGAQPAGSFTFMPSTSGNFYQYNVKTTGYPKATYTVHFTIAGDPIVHTVQFVIG
jgi:hypothetical protein